MICQNFARFCFGRAIDNVLIRLRRSKGSLFSLLNELVVIASRSTVVSVLGLVDELGLLGNSDVLGSCQPSNDHHGQGQREDVVEVESTVGSAVRPSEQEEIDRAEAQEHLDSCRANDSYPNTAR